MHITPHSLSDMSAARVSFGSCSIPSTPQDEVLVVAFEGEAGNTHEHSGTFSFMRAMMEAGVAAWQPDAVILDLRGLIYAWGDNMVEVLAIDSSLPVAVVVSDLNREALTSLVAEEMFAQPREWLFESLDEAVTAVERDLLAQRSA
jgi:hypothetical protein